jgi:hypothetical protein
MASYPVKLLVVLCLVLGSSVWADDLKLTFWGDESPCACKTRIPSYAQTYYISGERLRIDYFDPFRFCPDEPAKAQPYRIEIYQCDRKQLIEIDPRNRKYAVYEYPPKPAKGKFALPAPDPRRRVLLQREVVETGEEKMLFGHRARLVMITSRRIPQYDPTFSVQMIEESWDIDFLIRPPCGPSGLLSPGSRWPGPLVEGESVVYDHSGPQLTGYPIVRVSTSQGVEKLPDGTEKRFRREWRSEIVELSEAPLDPDFFEPPRDYKKVRKLRVKPPFELRMNVR